MLKKIAILFIIGAGVSGLATAAALIDSLGLYSVLVGGGIFVTGLVEALVLYNVADIKDRLNRIESVLDDPEVLQ